MLVLLLACAGPASTDDTQDTQPEPLPEAWTDHYKAVSRIEAGGFAFDEEYLVRRFSDPEASTIREEFVATFDGTLTETTRVIDLETSSFTLSFSDDSYEGTGTLEGPDWAWTGWESHSVATDGSWVDSVDTVNTEGVIHAEKVGYDPQGAQEWTLVEDLTPLSESEWQTQTDAL